MYMTARKVCAISLPLPGNRFSCFLLCQQLSRQAAGEVKDKTSSMLERHGIRLHGIFA